MRRIRPNRLYSNRLAAFLGLLLAEAFLAGCAGTAVNEAQRDADNAIRIAARANALENRKSGEGANWYNPETGTRGTIVPVRTFKSDYGEDCREFQETVTVGDRTDIYNGVSCRRQDGSWRIARGPYRHSNAAYDPWGPHWRYGVRHNHFSYWGPSRFGYGSYYGGW